MEPGKSSRRRPRAIRFFLRLSAIWAVALSSPLGAQTEGSASGLDGSESLESFLAETRTLRAEFQQELWSAEGQLIETAEGTLWLKRPNRFLWNYRTPFEQVVVADGVSLWIYDVELGQATVSPLDELISATPAMLLSGDRAVRDGFEVLESFAANEIDWVRLAPKLEGTDFSAVLIGFREGILASLELVDGLEQVTEIQFGEVEVNPAISDDSFEFSPPADIDIIGQPGDSGAAR